MPNDLVHTAKAFVLAHHYSRSWPAVRFAYGLIDTAAPPAGQLVGVLTLGIPTQVAVLTSVFGRLTPYEESLELNRLVLLDDVPANAETWAQARMFRMAAARGRRAPMPRAGAAKRRQSRPTHMGGSAPAASAALWPGTSPADPADWWRWRFSTGTCAR
jgi:hypothetical protein